jgi:hypothetical protein
VKTTVFQFELYLDAEQSTDELLKHVVNTMEEVNGVDKVESGAAKSIVTLRVFCSFPSADVAKQIHHRIIVSLRKINGVLIRKVTSTLSDVFD